MPKSVRQTLADVEAELNRSVTGPDRQPNSVELRQQRSRVIDQMRTITDSAERENRDVSGTAREDYETAERLFRALSDKITETEQREADEAAHGVPLGSGGFGNPHSRSRGAELLTRDQNLTDYVRRQGYRAEAGAQLGFGRLVRGMLLGDWRGADAERRALLESNAGQGGVLVPTPLAANVLDLARAQARVMAAGATTVPMESSTLKIGRQVADPAPEWHTEGAQINEDSSLAFDAVTLKAHTLPVLVRLSIEMLEDVDNIDGLVSNAVAQALALELDRVALLGTGVDPQPRGLANTTGVTHINADPAAGADGAPATWATLIRAVAAVKGANFEPNASIHSVRTEVDLGSQTDSTGQYLAAPPLLANLARLDTTQVPNDDTQGASTNASKAFVGQWSELMIGVRTSFQLQPLNELYADTGERGMLAFMRADVAPAHPAAFAVVDGITPAA